MGYLTFLLLHGQSGVLWHSVYSSCEYRDWQTMVLRLALLSYFIWYAEGFNKTAISFFFAFEEQKYKSVGGENKTSSKSSNI